MCSLFIHPHQVIKTIEKKCLTTSYENDMTLYKHYQANWIKLVEILRFFWGHWFFEIVSSEILMQQRDTALFERIQHCIYD